MLNFTDRHEGDTRLTGLVNLHIKSLTCLLPVSSCSLSFTRFPTWGWTNTSEFPNRPQWRIIHLEDCLHVNSMFQPHSQPICLLRKRACIWSCLGLCKVKFQNARETFFGLIAAPLIRRASAPACSGEFYFYSPKIEKTAPALQSTEEAALPI